MTHDSKALCNALTDVLSAMRSIETVEEMSNDLLQALRHLEETDGILNDAIETLENNEEEGE